MRLLFLLCLLLAGRASAQAPPAIVPVLDTAAVPYLTQAGREVYARFILVNLPRVFAIATNGAFDGAAGGTSLETLRAAALAGCADKGGTDCAVYAENLEVVWHGAAPAVPAPPGPLISSVNYAFVPDARYIWWGPGAARGVVVWSHGRGQGDSRGLQPPPVMRPFNNAGFDMVRFDREPNVDDRERAGLWLREGLADLRRRGWRMVVAAGQSRGAWNSLQVLDTAGLADVVIALSPAAHGLGPHTSAQASDLRHMLESAEPSGARVAFAQFSGDPYAGVPADRPGMFQDLLRPRIGALLLIDRPDGYVGHGAGGGYPFARQFGACLLHFALDPAPPGACP